MQTGYRNALVPAPPGAILKPSDLRSREHEMNVKSLITWPPQDATLKPGRHELRGIAWTGEGHVAKVEAAAGKSDAPSRHGPLHRRTGSLELAALACEFDLAEAGPVVFRARRRIRGRTVQPDETPYNKSGYLWNGIDKITANVG